MRARKKPCVTKLRISGTILFSIKTILITNLMNLSLAHLVKENLSHFWGLCTEVCYFFNGKMYKVFIIAGKLCIFMGKLLHFLQNTCISNGAR